MALSQEQEAELSLIAGAMFAVHSYQLSAVIAALAEAGLLRQDRVAVWASTFAEMFRNNVSHPRREFVADRLEEFATSLRIISQPPENSGRA